MRMITAVHARFGAEYKVNPGNIEGNVPTTFDRNQATALVATHRQFLKDAIAQNPLCHRSSSLPFVQASP
jgi:hypothetical protein